MPDIAPGEQLEVEIELIEPRFVSFTQGGKPLDDVRSANAIAFEDEALRRRHWHSGEAKRGGVEMELPSGRVLFEVSRARTGSNQCYLALVNQPGAEVELARNSIVIESAGGGDGLPPTASLVSIEGREVQSRWASELSLPVERDSEGHLVVACVPDGARVRLVGFDSRGAAFEATVDVPQTRFVHWP